MEQRYLQPVWDTKPRGILKDGIPYRAAWNTGPRGIPRRVGYRAVWDTVPLRDTMPGGLARALTNSLCRSLSALMLLAWLTMRWICQCRYLLLSSRKSPARLVNRDGREGREGRDVCFERQRDGARVRTCEGDGLIDKAESRTTAGFAAGGRERSVTVVERSLLRAQR